MKIENETKKFVVFPSTKNNSYKLLSLILFLVFFSLEKKIHTVNTVFVNKIMQHNKKKKRKKNLNKTKQKNYVFLHDEIK